MGWLQSLQTELRLQTHRGRLTRSPAPRHTLRPDEEAKQTPWIVKLLRERGTDVHANDAMNGSSIICKQEMETAELLWENGPGWRVRKIY